MQSIAEMGGIFKPAQAGNNPRRAISHETHVCNAMETVEKMIEFHRQQGNDLARKILRRIWVRLWDDFERTPFYGDYFVQSPRG